MPDRDKELQITRAKLLRLRDGDGFAMIESYLPQSAGVARWDRIGGNGGFISMPTQTEALRRATLTEQQRRDIAWFEAIYGAYLDLLQAPGRSANRAVHDRLVARVLKYYVFDRLTFERIGEMMGRTRKQYTSDLYAEAVEAVRYKAQDVGLFG